MLNHHIILPGKRSHRCCCCDSPAALLLSSVVQVKEVCDRSRVVPQVLHCKLHQMALTVEQMLYGVWCHSTLRADIWYAAGNAGLVTVQKPTVTTTQLGVIVPIHSRNILGWTIFGDQDSGHISCQIWLCVGHCKNQVCCRFFCTSTVGTCSRVLTPNMMEVRPSRGEWPVRICATVMHWRLDKSLCQNYITLH